LKGKEKGGGEKRMRSNATNYGRFCGATAKKNYSKRYKYIT
jgi:hypothetical protein